MKVFISSLIAGYEPLRQAARDAITSLGHDPVMAEDFRAQANSPQVACLQGLRSADLVVLILVDRYGTTQPASGVSPTHEEYLEARGEKPILLFVMEGIEPEIRQVELLREAQGWQGGMFREGFKTPEQLRGLITRALHQYELAHAAAPLDVTGLVSEADALVRTDLQDHNHVEPVLRFCVVGGPTRQLLRPAELEREALADELQQRAMFQAPRVFERDEGVRRHIEGDSLILDQQGGARISLSERGNVELTLPLEKRSRRSNGFGGIMIAIIEESVTTKLANAIAFTSWMLDHVDATQRISHVAMAAKIHASDHLAWRTQAEQDASPNSGTLRMGNAPARPSLLDRPRAALKYDAARLAEDLMVPLRRQWKA